MYISWVFGKRCNRYICNETGTLLGNSTLVTGALGIWPGIVPQKETATAEDTSLGFPPEDASLNFRNTDKSDLERKKGGKRFFELSLMGVGQYKLFLVSFSYIEKHPKKKKILVCFLFRR